MFDYIKTLLEDQKHKIIINSEGLPDNRQSGMIHGHTYLPVIVESESVYQVFHMNEAGDSVLREYEKNKENEVEIQDLIRSKYFFNCLIVRGEKSVSDARLALRTNLKEKEMDFLSFTNLLKERGYSIVGKPHFDFNKVNKVSYQRVINGDNVHAFWGSNLHSKNPKLYKELIDNPVTKSLFVPQVLSFNKCVKEFAIELANQINNSKNYQINSYDVDNSRKVVEAKFSKEELNESYRNITKEMLFSVHNLKKFRIFRDVDTGFGR